MNARSLAAGDHSYESVLAGIESGRYDFARIRTASGRSNHLIGVAPGQLRAMRKTASELQIGMILYGSRVSGPRARQQTLHPVLAEALPLKVSFRTGTKKYPGAQDLEIHKTTIKEFGIDDPRTSDITLIIADLQDRSDAEMREIADCVEDRFSSFGNSFPIRVFPALWGRAFRCEDDFGTFVGEYLQGRLRTGHAFSQGEVEAAARELFVYVGGSTSWLRKSDAFNGVLAAATTSVSFSWVLGFHPVLPIVGFLIGLFGRYLARARASLSEGASKLSLFRALAFDWLLGVLIMGAIINPVAGYRIAATSIIFGSLLHSLSRGSVRVGMDRLFSTGNYRQQAWGVALNTVSAVLLGVVTSFLYTGAAWTYAVHGCIFACGLAIQRLGRSGLPSHRLQDPG